MYFVCVGVEAAPFLAVLRHSMREVSVDAVHVDYAALAGAVLVGGTCSHDVLLL